jgi:hypothetical protein
VPNLYTHCLTDDLAVEYVDVFGDRALEKAGRVPFVRDDEHGDLLAKGGTRPYRE